MSLFCYVVVVVVVVFVDVVFVVVLNVDVVVLGKLKVVLRFLVMKVEFGWVGWWWWWWWWGGVQTHFRVKSNSVELS